jgi:putative ABC transport system ATP-binding protein
VEEGLVELVRTLVGGGEEVLARHSRGEYFGELGPMFKLPRSATARAAAPSRLIGLPVGDFRRSLQGQRPGAAS